MVEFSHNSVKRQSSRKDSAGRLAPVARLLPVALTVWMVWLSFVPESVHLASATPIWIVMALLLVLAGRAAGDTSPGGAVAEQWLLAFVASGFISVIQSEAIGAAWQRWLMAAVPFILSFALARAVVEEGHARTIIRAGLVCGLIIGALGCIEFLSGHNVLYERWLRNPYYLFFHLQHRVAATMPLPSVLASFCLVMLPIAAAAAATHQRVFRLLSGCALIVLAAALCLTGDLVAILIAVVVMGWYGATHRSLGRYVILMAAGLVLAAACIAGRELGRTAVWRMTPSWLVSNVQRRVEQYPLMARLIVQRPLTGYGAAAMPFVRDPVATTFRRETPNPIRVIDQTYVTMAFELGLVGLLLFSGLVIAVAHMVYWHAPRRRSR